MTFCRGHWWQTDLLHCFVNQAVCRMISSYKISMGHCTKMWGFATNILLHWISLVLIGSKVFFESILGFNYPWFFTFVYFRTLPLKNAHIFRSIWAKTPSTILFVAHQMKVFVLLAKTLCYNTSHFRFKFALYRESLGKTISKPLKPTSVFSKLGQIFFFVIQGEENLDARIPKCSKL